MAGSLLLEPAQAGALPTPSLSSKDAQNFKIAFNWNFKVEGRNRIKVSILKNDHSLKMASATVSAFLFWIDVTTAYLVKASVMHRTNFLWHNLELNLVNNICRKKTIKGFATCKGHTNMPLPPAKVILMSTAFPSFKGETNVYYLCHSLGSYWYVLPLPL